MDKHILPPKSHFKQGALFLEFVIIGRRTKGGTSPCRPPASGQTWRRTLCLFSRRSHRPCKWPFGKRIERRGASRATTCPATPCLLTKSSDGSVAGASRPAAAASCAVQDVLSAAAGLPRLKRGRPLTRPPKAARVRLSPLRRRRRRERMRCRTGRRKSSRTCHACLSLCSSFHLSFFFDLADGTKKLCSMSSVCCLS